MIRLLVVLVALFLLWQLWRKITLDRDAQTTKRLRQIVLSLGAIALLAFGLWMAASGRLHFAWIGLLGLLTLLRRGMFFYQLWRRLTSFQHGGFNSFFQSAKRAGEEAARKRKTAGMSRRRAAEILGVSENASKKQITRAFHAKMRNSHPDVGGSEKIARELNAARDTMLNS